MERVAFLIEETGERVFAMMNPEELVFARQAGVRPRQFADRPLAQANQSDDPLIQVGGGVTDLTLNLLFDVDLHKRSTTSFSEPARQSSALELQSKAQGQVGRPELRAEAGASTLPKIEDVRELSGPLWQFAENNQDGTGLAGPPTVHLIWGSAWFVRCVVIRVAERFDVFSADGNPQRSWMRVHLRRMHMEIKPRQHESKYSPPIATSPGGATKQKTMQVRTITDPVASSRPDLLCDEIYGDTSFLHDLLDYNDVDDFWDLEPGFNLSAPPLDVLKGGRDG